MTMLIYCRLWGKELLEVGGQGRLGNVQGRELLVQALDDLNHLGTSLDLELILLGKNLGKDGQEQVQVAVNPGVLGTDQREQEIVHGDVLLIVELQGQSLDKHGQDLVNGDGVGVTHDHASDSSAGIVRHILKALALEQGV